MMGATMEPMRCLALLLQRRPRSLGADLAVGPRRGSNRSQWEQPGHARDLARHAQAPDRSVRGCARVGE